MTADKKFCGSCGAARQSDATVQPQSQPQPNAVVAKSGSPALKIILVVIALGFGLAVLVAGGAVYFGKKKLDEWRRTHDVASANDPASPSGATADRTSSSRHGEGITLLTKEEVGEIIGEPVTSIESNSPSHATYKTANLYIDAGIEIERKDDEADAIREMAAERTVTKTFGGTGNAVPGLGDDAIYGAYNSLVVRKHDVVLTITPPKLAMAAQAAQTTKMMSEAPGSDAQVKDIEKLSGMMKGSQVTNSLAKPDAVSGAVDLIKHAATEPENEYDTKARLMARQLAEKALAKIGP